jgi:hypothetical protein
MLVSPSLRPKSRQKILITQEVALLTLSRVFSLQRTRNQFSLFRLTNKLEMNIHILIAYCQAPVSWTRPSFLSWLASVTKQEPNLFHKNAKNLQETLLLLLSPRSWTISTCLKNLRAFTPKTTGKSKQEPLAKTSMRLASNRKISLTNFTHCSTQMSSTIRPPRLLTPRLEVMTFLENATNWSKLHSGMVWQEPLSSQLNQLSRWLPSSHSILRSWNSIFGRANQRHLLL